MPSDIVMPARGHSTAPSFKGKAIDITQYFEDLEQLFTQAKVADEKEKIRYAKHYLDTEYTDTWDVIAIEATTTWAMFKAEVVKLYPGAERERRYALSDLETIVDERRENEIKDREELGKYYRDFKTIAHYLLDKRISEGERDRLFIKGFQTKFRERILGRLAILEPTKVPEDGYPFEDVNKAADWLLTGSRLSANLPSTVKAVVESSTSAEAQPKVKAEVSDEVRLLTWSVKQLAERMDALATSQAQVGSMARPPPATQPQYNRPQYSRGYGEQASNNCHFCGERHFMRECPEVGRYIREGKIVRNTYTNRLELQSGQPLPRGYETNNFKEGVDAYLRDQARTVDRAPGQDRDPPPHVSANLFEVASPAVAEQFNLQQAKEVEVSDEAWFRGWMENFENAAKDRVTTRKGAQKMDAVEMKIGPPRGVKKTVTFAPTTPDAAKVPAPPTVEAKKAEPRKAEAKSGNGKEFRFQLSVEGSAPKAAEQIFGRLMEQTISISARDLLALAPDIRKQFKEAVALKKIPISAEAMNSLQTYFYDDDEHTLDPDQAEVLIQRVVEMSNEDLTPLIVVRPTVVGRVRPECILDSGSQIVAMRCDIWNQTGMNISIQGSRDMVAANNTVNSTVGIVKEMPFTFGGITIKCPVHVLDDAPYEVLLGRPFTTRARARTEDHPDGTMTLTIRDPETGEAEEVPTEMRERSNGPRNAETDF